MNLIENKNKLAEMTLPQIHKYISLLEDRVLYLDLERSKYQAQSQGLTALRTMYRQQSKRFGKTQTKLAQTERELFRLKKIDQTFKISSPPKVRKTKLNKHRKKALLRRTTAVTFPSSVATFQDSPLSSLSSSPSRYGSPLFYNSPQQYPNFQPSPRVTFESQFIAYDLSRNNESFIDSLYSPSASPVVDLDG